jgi:NADH-quinone oxidoreductase subunit N
MLALAGFPATAGFFGKVYLIGAAVDNGYAWLGVAIVGGSAISLAYYLRVVAAVWMRAPGTQPAVGGGVPRPAIAGGAPEADGLGDPSRPAIAGGSPEADGPVAPSRLFQPEVVGLALLCAAATIFFGVYPEPLLDLAHDAGAALTGIF